MWKFRTHHLLLLCETAVMKQRVLLTARVDHLHNGTYDVTPRSGRGIIAVHQVEVFRALNKLFEQALDNFPSGIPAHADEITLCDVLT